jgi:hypothetical protein
MKTEYKTIVPILLVSIMCGCQTEYSLVENSIRNKIPDAYKQNTDGIVSNPTASDIEQAVQLGKSSKDNDVLAYAYLTKAPRGFFSTDEVYVKVQTPLFLVADHAREQAREYRSVDPEFVEYAKNLKAVRISVTQQYLNTNTFYAYAFDRQMILLRDGVRVEALQSIPSWDGKNPFADKMSKQMDAVLANVGNIANQYTKGYLATMSDEQKQQLVQSYKAMGYSDQKIQELTGISTGEGANEPGSVGTVQLTEYDGVFPLEEVCKPGNYEIIFRTRKINRLVLNGDKEIRFPISFDKFK